MSEEEQDLIHGRLMRQGRESRYNVAALEGKLLGYYKSLTDVGVKLNGTWNPKPKPVTTFEQAISSVNSLPSKEEIIEALNELRREQENLRSLEAQLEAMN